MTFWDLPGATRYIEKVAQALRLGSNVLVRFPGTIPSAFRDRVFSVLIGDWLRPTAMRCGSRPLETLCERFLHVDCSSRDRLRCLIDSGDFRERLIWLDGVSAEEWKPWHEFLVQYTDASRAVEVHRRTLFLIPLICTSPGDACMSSQDSLSRDTLRVFEWDNIIDEMDILSYAGDRLLRRGVDRSSVGLIATTVARLAIWDFDSAERLVEERPKDILNPVPVLRGVARQMGWDGDTPICWECGTASQSGIGHPARLSIEQPAREIERRVWSAQASVLLPEIDIQRVEIIRSNLYEVRRWLKDHDRDLDPFDLEIGKFFEIFQSVRADPVIRQRISHLRSVRNSLAHLESVPFRTAVRVARILET